MLSEILDKEPDHLPHNPGTSPEMNSAIVESTPNQPVDNIPNPQVLPNKTIRFQTKWYQQFTWLHYIAEKDSVFCFTCLTATKRSLLSQSTKTEPAFTVHGFRNWKKAKERFLIHQNGQQHREALTKILAEKNNSIISGMNNATIASIQQNREALKAICSSLKFLARQGLAVQGHGEDSGNFMELLRLRVKDIPALGPWLMRSKLFTGHEVQNEILDIMATKITTKLANDVKSADYFSVIADETTDISTKEQMSIIFRFPDKNLDAVEHFIGLYEMNSTTGESIANAILDVILRLGLSVNKLRGQCYDGASNMSGKYKGAQAKIREREPRAVYVHCANHSLNLALQDSVRSVPLMRDVLQYVNDVAVLIGRSAKRLTMFEEVAHELGQDKVISLKALCPTRWCVRVKSLTSLLSNYAVVLVTLQKLKLSKDPCSSTASGLLKHFEAYETLFAIVTLLRFFTPCETLSVVLQSPSVTLSGSINAATILVSKLETMLTPDEFERVQNEVNSMATEFEVNAPSLPRRRSVPAKYKDVLSVADPGKSIKEWLWNLYKDTLESLIAEIKHRFNRENLSDYCLLEQIIMDGNIIDSPASREVLEKHEIDHVQLGVQLSMFKATATDTSSVKACIDSFKALHLDVQKMLSSVRSLVSLMIVIPSSNASSERSFSLVRRLKTYVRSTMTQRRLNNLCIITTYQELVSEMEDEDIMKEFVNRKSYRISQFGNF